MKTPSKRPKWSAVVLAAGRSSRAGSVNKLLIPFGGKAMLSHVLEAVTRSDVDEIIVVTGYQQDRVKPVVRSALAQSAKTWRMVHATHYERGLSASLKRGLKAVSPFSQGAVICLGDMPLLSAPLIDALLAAYRPGDRAVVPVTGTKWGNPVLISRDLFPKLRELQGDQGARAILEKTKGRVRLMPVSGSAIHTDIDRPGDLAGLRAGPGP